MGWPWLGVVGLEAGTARGWDGAFWGWWCGRIYVISTVTISHRGFADKIGTENRALSEKKRGSFLSTSCSILDLSFSIHGTLFYISHFFSALSRLGTSSDRPEINPLRPLALKPAEMSHPRGWLLVPLRSLRVRCYWAKVKGSGMLGSGNQDPATRGGK